MIAVHFNSHPHEEDDLAPQMNHTESVISTHILTKRMTGVDKINPLIYNYFNSHPHEEDDYRHRSSSYNYDISTHILTKRMTDGTEVYYPSQHISTHILTKRMT